MTGAHYRTARHFRRSLQFSIVKNLQFSIDIDTIPHNQTIKSQVFGDNYPCRSHRLKSFATEAGRLSLIVRGNQSSRLSASVSRLDMYRNLVSITLCWLYHLDPDYRTVEIQIPSSVFKSNIHCDRLLLAPGPFQPQPEALLMVSSACLALDCLITHGLTLLSIRVYPRSCGEHVYSIVIYNVGLGLSPPVCGNSLDIWFN